MNLDLRIVTTCLALGLASGPSGCGSVGSGGDSGGEDTETGGTTGELPDELEGDPVLPPPPDDVPPGEPGIELAKSGDRLRPVVTQAGDAMDFVIWYDTLLEVECQFLPTAEGLRCLPDLGYVSYDGPQCDQPVFGVHGDPAPPFLVDYEGGNCSTSYRVWTVTGEEREPNPLCYGGDGYPPPAIRDLTPVDLTTFVGGTRSTSEAEGYGDHRLDADDGAWRIIGAAHDGFPCDLRDYGGAEVCLDTRANPGVCGSISVACDPVEHAIHYGPCGTQVTEVVAVDGGQDAVAVCGNDIWEGGLAYSPGAVLPPDALPATAAGYLGTGRVRVRAMADDGGTIRWPQNILPLGPWVRLFDTRFGVPCTAHATEDGPVRCMPAIGVGSPEGIFADSDCSIPAYRGVVSVEGPEACEYSGYETSDPIFGKVWHGDDLLIHGVVPHDGPIYEAGDGGACTETGLPSGVTEMFRAEGGPVPEEEFPEVERVTLP